MEMMFFKKINFEVISNNHNYFLELLKKHKVLVIENYSETLPVFNYVENIISNFGSIVNCDENLKNGYVNGDKYMEISFDPNDQTKYRTAKVNQPLHTDYSYIDVNNVIQFLMCIKKAQLGGATTFIDTKLLVDMLLLDKNENLYNRLLSIPVNHLKGNKSKISPILIKDNLDFKINWNYPPAKKGENSKEAILLIEEFKEWLDSRVEKSGLLTSVLLENNDIVFFHDYRVLHGRNCYFANVVGDRKLIKGTLVL